jgi:hypothetical protein
MKISGGNVFIHVDSLRREKSISCLIKNVLEKIGYNVFLTSRRNLRLLSIGLFTKIFRPSSIILSHVGGTFTKDELYKMSQKSSLFLLMPEGFVDDVNLELAFPIDFDYRVFSAIFVWGNHVKNWLIKNRNLSKDKIVVAGFHRFDLYGLHDDFLDELTSKTSKKSIGFIGELCTIDTFDKRNLLAEIVGSIDIWYDVIGCVSDQVKILVLYSKIFDYVYKKTDYIMSYRPHPNESVDSKNLFKSKYGDRFSVSVEEDFNSWVLSQDIIISPASTSYVDAYILGKPVISIRKAINAGKWDPSMVTATEAFDEYAYTPNDFKELVDLLTVDNLKPRESKKTQDILRDYYDWPRDDYVTEEIVKTVMKYNPIKKHNIVGKLLIKFLSIADYYFFTLRRLKDKKKVEVFYNYNSHYHKCPEYVKTLSDKIVARIKATGSNKQ